MSDDDDEKKIKIDGLASANQHQGQLKNIIIIILRNILNTILLNREEKQKKKKKKGEGKEGRGTRWRKKEKKKN